MTTDAPAPPGGPDEGGRDGRPHRHPAHPGHHPDTPGHPDRFRNQRAELRLRHTQALTALMEERADLRGVHALADHFDDAVRWSAEPRAGVRRPPVRVNRPGWASLPPPRDLQARGRRAALPDHGLSSRAWPPSRRARSASTSW